MFSLTFLRANARLIGFGFALCFFSSAGQTYFIAVFGGELRQAFSLSHGEFGTVYMAGTLGSAFTLIWLGRLVDHWSVARTAWTTLVALAAVCIFTGLTWNAFALAVAIYGLRLMGQGMAIHIGLTAMARFFVAERGTAVGLATLGNAAGAAASPVFIVTLLAFMSWREAWWAASAVILCAIPGVLWLIKGEDLKARSDALRQRGGQMLEAGYRLKDVLRDPGLWLRLPVLLAPSFITTGLVFHQVHIGAEKGWSPELVAGSFSAYAIATVAGLFVMGPLVDRFSARQSVPFFPIPLGLCALSLALADAPWTVPVYMGLMGFGTGLSQVTQGALWAELYGVTHIGAIRSFATAIMVFSSGLAPAVMGLGFDNGVSVEGMAYACALACLAAAVVAGFAGRPPPLPQPE